MLARFVRARSVTILAGLVLLSFNRHSPKLCSYDCVDSCILHRIVYSFSNGFNRLLTHATVPPNLSAGSKGLRYSLRLSEVALSRDRRSCASWRTSHHA